MKQHPIDYLVAGAVSIERDHDLPYSEPFRELVTIALSGPSEPAEANPVEQAAMSAVSESVRLALANNDVDAVPGIIGMGVTLAMRFALISRAD